MYGENMNKIEMSICDYLLNYPPSEELFSDLNQISEVYLIGGVLREYRDNKQINNLRDIDIIVNVIDEEEWNRILNRYKPVRNRFGGYKLICGELVVDLWRIEESWAYREHVIRCPRNELVINLPRTVFLNIDAIIYDLKNDVWYDDLYEQAMNSKCLDIVLEKNPQIPLNIVRTFVLKEKYEMILSEKLKSVIKKEIIRIQQTEEDVIEYLNMIQINRYNKAVISKDKMKIFLENL